jgi:hypothetical protein
VQLRGYLAAWPYCSQSPAALLLRMSIMHSPCSTLSLRSSESAMRWSGYGLGLLLLVPLGDLLNRQRLIIGQLLLSVRALLSVALAPNGTLLLAVVTQLLVAYAAALISRVRPVKRIAAGVDQLDNAVRTASLAASFDDELLFPAVYFVGCLPNFLSLQARFWRAIQ